MPSCPEPLCLHTATPRQPWPGPRRHPGIALAAQLGTEASPRADIGCLSLAWHGVASRSPCPCVSPEPAAFHTLLPFRGLSALLVARSPHPHAAGRGLGARFWLSGSRPGSVPGQAPPIMESLPPLTPQLRPGHLVVQDGARPQHSLTFDRDAPFLKGFVCET